jgi:hypothetical protein
MREQGYERDSPEGRFYMLVRAPLADEAPFVVLLAAP